MATDGTSDEYVQQLVNTGIVKDILIEAQRVPDGEDVKGAPQHLGGSCRPRVFLGKREWYVESYEKLVAIGK